MTMRIDKIEQHCNCLLVWRRSHVSGKGRIIKASGTFPPLKEARGIENKNKGVVLVTLYPMGSIPFLIIWCGNEALVKDHWEAVVTRRTFHQNARVSIWAVSVIHTATSHLPRTALPFARVKHTHIWHCT